MRILFCSEQPPVAPLHDGVRVLLEAVVRELEQRHEVRIVSLFEPRAGDVDPRRENLRLVARPSTNIVREAARVLRAELTRRPLRADSLAARLGPVVREEVRAFAPDVVHVVTGQLAGIRDALEGRPAVLVAQDAWYRNIEGLAAGSAGLRRLMYRREVARVRRFERREYASYEAVVVVTEEDAEALSALGARLPLHVIPNGVDGQLFCPDPSTTASPMSMVFHGNLGYSPTTTAARVLAEQILPLVRAEVPEASVTIVGRRPPPSILALGSADPAVRIAGDVEDVPPWLRAAGVYAAPMTTGSGIKNKVLEAMACGRACVVTPLALQGLQASVGKDLLVAQELRQFARCVIDLLEDPGRAREMGENARAYVLREHDWRAVAARYESLYESVAGRA